MKQNELFPKIRFKEFTNTWEQEKLENIVDRGGTGGTPNTSNPKYYNGKIPFLTISDLTKTDGHIYSTEKKITKEGLNSSSAWVVPKGSLTLSIYATIGKIGILNNDTATSQAFYSMVIKDDSIRKYLFYYFKKCDLQNYWFRLISTGTQANLNSEKIRNSIIKIPKNFQEREKLVTLLSNLDQLIAFHQCKLNLLKNAKNRLLEKMFCDEKSQFPTIRFKEFTNTWEQEKFNELVKYQSSRMTLKDLTHNEKYDVYDANKIAGKTNNQPITEEYISIIKYGAAAGTTRLLPKNTMVLSTMGVILANNSNIRFIYFLISSKSNFSKEINGSTIPHIYFKDYGKKIYCIPFINEQSKISSLFYNLDSLITLHQRKLELLKNVKNALLEKMFV